MRLIATLTVAATFLLALFSSEASATFKVNATVGADTHACTAATSLTHTGGASSTVTYSCSQPQQTSNSCTASGAMVYDLSTGTVNVPCSNLVTTGLIVDALFGGVQNGDGSQTPSTPGNVCTNATNVAYAPGTNTFTWTCGTFVGVCQPSDTTTLNLGQNRVSVVCPVAAPTGTGQATPSNVVQTTQTLLTVGVIPASNPTSTGITVTGDLSLIGGVQNAAFHDDGLNGDATAGDNVYSFLATVPLGTTAGAKSLPITIADNVPRSSQTTIDLTVVGTINPTGLGAASPAIVAPASSTVLTVRATGGSNPASTGLAVRADLSAIGGSATQAFVDDGTNGDAVAGDGIFTYTAAIPFPFLLTAGPRSLPVTVTDSIQRTGTTTIDVNVLASTNPTGFAIGTPDNIGIAGNVLLTVRTFPGKHPASTGITVGANLSAIGGSASQALLDDGQNGDAVAGDGVYTFQLPIGAATPAGPVDLPVSVTDAQGRTSNTAIALNITTVGGLSALGSPATITVGKPYVLRVTVTPATVPTPSTGIMVGADLGPIGGASPQMFFDDGSSGGDQTAGDNVFTFLGALPTTTPSGPIRIQAVATDAQNRSAPTGIVINVRGDNVFDDGYDADVE